MKIRLQPLKCNHVLVKDENDRIVEVTTKDVLLTGQTEQDSELIRRIKWLAGEYKAKSIEGISSVIGSREF